MTGIVAGDLMKGIEEAISRNVMIIGAITVST
jgi:hypothetical protein